jgi:lipoprotein signal peptidase
VRQEGGKESGRVSFWGFLILGLDLFLQMFFRDKNFGLENRGVSFGLAPEMGKIIALVAFGFFVGWYLYERIVLKRNRWPLYLMALGGVSNIVSRLVWGSVWDYICLPFLPFCFNLADVLISMGVVSYILGVNGNRNSLRGQRDTGH